MRKAKLGARVEDSGATQIALVPGPCILPTKGCPAQCRVSALECQLIGQPLPRVSSLVRISPTERRSGISAVSNCTPNSASIARIRLRCVIESQASTESGPSSSVSPPAASPNTDKNTVKSLSCVLISSLRFLRYATWLCVRFTRDQVFAYHHLI